MSVSSHTPSALDVGTAHPVRIAIEQDCDLVLTALGAWCDAHPDRARLSRTWSSPHDVDLLLVDPHRGLFGGAAWPAPVVAYSWDQSPLTVWRSLSAGARGFVSKEVALPDLVSTLERVLAGERVVRYHVSDRASEHTHDRLTQGRLSTREIEVLCRITEGDSNVEIAQTMYVSVNTIKTYIRSAYRKIGVGTRTEAVRWCLATHRVPGPQVGAPAPGLHLV